QQCRRYQPGELQKLRRIECATGDDVSSVRVGDAFRLTLPVFNPDRTASRKNNPARQRSRDDGEVCPSARGAQIPYGGRPAAAVLRGELEIPGAFLLGPVEIVVAREARLPP